MSINIAFGVDLKFLPQARAVISSVLSTSQRADDLRFHILHAADDGSIARMVSAWNKAAVRAVPVTNPYAESSRRLSPAVALRMLLPDALPDIDRVIYLDADTVVLHDIADLASVDLGGRPIGGVIDAGMYVVMARRMARGDNELRDYLLSHGFDPVRRHYINSGVLVMDLEKLRAMNFSSKALFLASSEAERFHWFDQCIINKVLMDQIAFLDPRWNALANAIQMKRRHRFAAPDTQSMLKLQRDDPWIIHYAGGKKPWLTDKAWHAGTWWQHADDSWPRPPKGPFSAIWDRWFRAA